MAAHIDIGALKPLQTSCPDRCKGSDLFGAADQSVWQRVLYHVITYCLMKHFSCVKLNVKDNFGMTTYLSRWKIPSSHLSDNGGRMWLTLRHAPYKPIHTTYIYINVCAFWQMHMSLVCATKILYQCCGLYRWDGWSLYPSLSKLNSLWQNPNPKLEHLSHKITCSLCHAPIASQVSAFRRRGICCWGTCSLNTEDYKSITRLAVALSSIDTNMCMSRQTLLSFVTCM